MLIRLENVHNKLIHVHVVNQITDMADVYLKIHVCFGF